MDPALITGATAIATGLLGYSGARLQHRGEEGRLQVERDRVGLERVRLEGELEDARTQRVAQAVEEKRVLYCEYLENAEAPWSLCQRLDAVTESHVDEWWLGYQGVRRQVRIGGSQEIVENMLTVNGHIAALFVDLVKAVREGSSEEEIYHQRIRVWGQHAESVESALRELEAAMRADISL